MESEIERYRGALKQESSRAHEIAPISALYEDCLQYFQQLCNIAEASQAEKERAANVAQECAEKELMKQAGQIARARHFTIDDCFSKFRDWGSNTGASSRSLDHALRKSSQLQETTKELLEDLFSTLCHTRDSLQEAAMPFLSPPINNNINYFNTQQGSREQGSSGASSDSDASELQQLTEDIEESVNCLLKLLPALQDPAPQDIYRKDAPRDEASHDIEMAKKMFPKASQSLSTRLGFANWKRRQYIRDLELRNRPILISKPKPKGIEVQHHDSGYFSKSDFTRFGRRIGFSSHQDNRSQGTSEEGLSSRPDSVFSKPNNFSSQSATSVADSDMQVRLTRYDVPKLPVTLGVGESFGCRYCGQEIIYGVHVNSDDDWAHHIYMDLEPYLCTFDNCIRADKTFGQREDWFQHELENHRIQKIWCCQSCTCEFDDKDDLELHLSEKHKSSFPPENVSVVASLCERFSQRMTLDQPCPLCGLHPENSTAVKEHISDHLEQLALSCIETEESGLLSPLNDENSFESKIKFKLLNDFLEEQRGYIPQLPHGLPDDDGSADSNVAFAEDSDDEGIDRNTKRPEVIPKATSRISRPPMQRRGDSWMSKVNSFLDKQPAKQAGGDLWMAKVESFLDHQPMQEDQSERSPTVNEHAHSPVLEGGNQLDVLTRPLRPFRTKPPPRNKDFVGRVEDLAKLHSILAVSGAICVLNGAGGIGKTDAAIEYTYRYEEAFSYIFWISAETTVSCADTYSLIATQFMLTAEDTDYDQDRLITLGREFLERPDRRWLLVFDNVNTWSDIEEYLPTESSEIKGSILITSRKSDLGSNLSSTEHHNMQLGQLTLEEGRQLLLQSMQPTLNQKEMSSHPEYNLAGEIASLAERVPLALAHIAGFVQVSSCTLTDFVQLWNERRRHNRGSVQAPNPLALSTDKALDTVWNIGLRAVTIDARELLNILAFLDSETIQRRLLVGEHEEPSLDFLHSDQTFRYKRMITELSRRRLITVRMQDDQEVLGIHRSLQQKILQDLDKDPQKRDEVFSQAFNLIRKRFPIASPIQVPEPEKWPACKEYLPHVLNLQKIVLDILPSIAPSAKVARLLSDGGINLWERGMTSEGLRLLRSAEAILDKLDFDESQLRASIHIIIALLLQDDGITQITESMDRIWKALQIRKDHANQTKPEDYTRNQDILLHNAWSDYGCVLLQYNKYEEAEQIFSQCLTKYCEWGTEEEIPYEYYKFNHHTSFCRLYHKDFPKAIELAQESLRCITLATGQSSATYKTKFDLACILLQSGDVQGSLDMHKEILEARLRQHGKFSFLTLNSYYAVGALSAYAGNLSGAERWMHKALTLSHSRKGSWSEAAVARAEFHLSQILKQQWDNTNEEGDEGDEEIAQLAASARKVLARLLPLDPLPPGVVVKEEDELALFDHLQPVFDGRFTGRAFLGYVCGR